MYYAKLKLFIRGTLLLPLVLGSLFAIGCEPENKPTTTESTPAPAATATPATPTAPAASPSPVVSPSPVAKKGK